MNGTATRWGRRAALALGAAWAATAAADQTPQLTTEYRNPWCVTAPGGIYSNYYENGVGTPLFGGSAANPQ